VDLRETQIAKRRSLCVKSDRDIRSDVFRAAVDTNTVLLSMTAPESTLDNIFARITGSGQEGT
jgi:hypothetical protein